MSDENIMIAQEQPEEIVEEQPTQEEVVQDEIPAEEPTEETPADDIPQDALPQNEEGASEATEEPDSTEEVPAEEPAIDPIAELMKRPPYHERYYLRYNGGKRTAALDLEGTKSFLQGLGFDGGELRQAREGKGQSELFQNTEKKKNQMYCSYCGTEIAGVEYFRLPDGRLRCTACSRSIVNDKEEIQELCKRVISNMDTFFGATVDVPVSIEVLDERKLKKKVGVPIGTKDEQSMLILGVAVNKKKKYTILLENGAPRISLVATFAHELTHIWQYTHWDNNKKLKPCPKNNRLIVYEGMAKWAEIQYLYLIGETNVAKREEFITRNRQDEYGVGFCLYDQRYPLTREAMTCEETPFVSDKYPFDD